MKILVVDDNPLSLKLLNHQLTKIGFSVLQANSFENAIVLLQKNKIDALILDCQMLDNRLKINNTVHPVFYKYIKIGIVNSDYPKVKIDKMALWIDLFISRPIDIGVLRETLSSGIENVRVASENKFKNSHAIMKIVLDTTSKDICSAFEYLNSGDMLSLASVVHRIKGVYLMMSDLEVVDLCRSIESVLKDDENIKCIEFHLKKLKNKLNS
ncbi:response regulator, partial [Vibrio cholerae]|nr:response regulator [Vibrio cholerae]ELJ8645488.1 response regulator [Vibrio cholerae]